MYNFKENNPTNPCVVQVRPIMGLGPQLMNVCVKYQMIIVVCVSDSTPLSWWFGGQAPGQIQTHWAGALPGSRQCACALHNNCLNSNVQCNCDADSEQWCCNL